MRADGCFGSSVMGTSCELAPNNVILPGPGHRRMAVAGNEGKPLEAWGWDFDLYPNPATGELNVLLPEGSPVNLSIMDVAGREVFQTDGLSEGMHRLDLRDLVPGAYSVRVTSGAASKTKLLIKR